MSLTCLFHTDATVPAFLRLPEGRPLAGDLLVECATAPALAFALDLETPAAYPGIAGLLGNLTTKDLAITGDHLPVPIILAPGTAVSPLALQTALDRLRRRNDRHPNITLLVPLSEAHVFGAALALCDRFALAWNATSFPPAALAAGIEALAAEGLIEPSTFAGFFPYTPDLLDGTAARHIGRLAQLLGPLAARFKTIPAQVLVPSS